MGVSTFRRLHENYAQQKSAAAASVAQPEPVAAEPEGKPSEPATVQGEGQRSDNQQRQKRG